VLALLTSGLTASIALEQTGGLRLPFSSPTTSSDQPPPNRQPTVLVTAAAGGTGQFAVQLAKLAGCRVVATCGGDEKAALLQGLGADRVINYRCAERWCLSSCRWCEVNSYRLAWASCARI
jgi:NADPH:quinone reductase-like Zn-dependent oxidoreductase